MLTGILQHSCRDAPDTAYIISGPHGNVVINPVFQSWTWLFAALISKNGRYYGTIMVQNPRLTLQRSTTESSLVEKVI